MTTMTDAEIIAQCERNSHRTPEHARLFALARIGAKVVAADEATVERVAKAIDDAGECGTCGTPCAGCTDCDCARPTWIEPSSSTKARAALASVGE